MTQDLYYIDEGYYDSGYFVYTADAEATVNSEFSQSCTAQLVAGGVTVDASGSFNSEGTTTLIVSKIADGVATFSFEFTQTATLSHIYGSDLFAFSEAAIAVQVDRIRSTNIDASIAFDVATSVERIQQGDADADAVFEAITNGLRSRDVNLETQAAFSFVAEGGFLVSTDANINSESSQSSTVEKLINADASAVIEFVISAGLRLIRDAHLTGFNSISLLVEPNVIVNPLIEISSEVSLTTEASKKTEIEAFCDDLFYSSSTADRTRGIQASLVSEFTASIDGKKRIRGVASLATEFTVFADTTRIKQLASDASLETSLTAIISNIRGVDIVVSDFASLTAEATATKRAASSLTTSFTASTTAYNVKQASTIVKYVKDNYVDPFYVDEFSTVANLSSLTANVMIVAVTRATADLTSDFAVVANNNTIKQSESNNDIVSSVSADADVIADGVISTVSLFSPSFTVEAVRNSFAVLDSVASVDAAPIKTTELFEDLSSELTVSATIEITAVAASALASEFTQSSTVDITVSPSLSLSSEFAVSVTADITREVASSINAASELTSDGVRVRYADSTASSQFIVSAEVSNIMFQSINLVSQTSLEFVGYRTRDNIIETTSIASNLVIIEVQTDNQITVSIETSLSADATLFKGVIVDAFSNSQCELTAVRVKSLASAVSSEINLTATAQTVSEAIATISSSFSTNIVATKTGEIVLLVSNFATLYADADVIEQLATDLLTSIELSVVAIKTAVAESSLVSVSQQIASVGKIVPGGATLVSNGGLLSVIKSIQLQEIVYIIPGEGWTYKIAGESGIHNILGESRLRSITGESRERRITGESRIHTID